jgi:hypothetical protein
VRELFARYLEDKGTLLSLGETSVATQSSITSWESALECGFDSRIAHQSGLCGQAVYWSKSLPASAHPAVCHSSPGQPAHGQDPTPAEAWVLVGTVPALVSLEDFDRVQVKLALNKKQATRNNKGYRYLLRAPVSCGACQSACIARTTNGGLRYYICRCQAQPIYSQHDQRCRSRCIRARATGNLYERTRNRCCFSAGPTRAGSWSNYILLLLR